MSDLFDTEQETIPLDTYTEKAYLDYSMYVINDRALPFVGDGLKPVQRRIIYSMSQLGLTHTAKHSKSARTVGDVIGKYHPHGDAACYESMVLMAQEFSFRYPLVDGQGNWGAPDDPKSFAAQRYTEARLSRWAQLLLSELGQRTTDYTPNFDGSLDEPVCLPARVPFVLLNGGTGIAVGMATDVLPHNLREVVQACVHLLRNPKATTLELMEFIRGPDLPSGALITSSEDDLRAAYETGNQTLRGRAKYVRENGDVVITELPYQSSPSKVLAQIAGQMNAKRLPLLTDLRDESDHENPTRLVLVPRSNRVDIERLMQHLYATTDLERTYKFNLNVIGLNMKPRVMSLRELLVEWLKFRRDTVRRRLENRLDIINRRLHLIEGLLIAYLNLDEVIRIIREADNPRSALIDQFKLTDEQANAILEIRLRQLAKLEQAKLEKEQEELHEEADDLAKTLESTRRMNTLIRKELEEIAEEYGDERRTVIEALPEAKAFAADELLSNDPVTVVLSEKGWVRSAKGFDIKPTELPYRTGDSFLTAVPARTNQFCTFLDSMGRSYTMPVRELPSARGQGEPLTGRFTTEVGAKFVGAIIGEKGNVLLATDEGVGFVAPLNSLLVNKRSGKAIVNVTAEWGLLEPRLIQRETLVASVTSEGYLLIVNISDLPLRNRGRGVKIQSIPAKKLKSKEETVVYMVPLSEQDSLVLHSGQRKFTIRGKDLEPYRGERARRGKMLPRGFRTVRNVEVLRKHIPDNDDSGN